MDVKFKNQKGEVRIFSIPLELIYQLKNGKTTLETIESQGSIFSAMMMALVWEMGRSSLITITAVISRLPGPWTAQVIV